MSGTDIAYCAMLGGYNSATSTAPRYSASAQGTTVLRPRYAASCGGIHCYTALSSYVHGVLD
eukprot:3416716-Rhodomonas_salina.2